MNAQAKVETATLASAMAAAFGEIEGATKSANNPHFKTKYADLTSVIEAIKPALINHGLFFTQRPQACENGVTITTILHHASGETLELGSLFVPANRNDAQGFGSALTYARRYALVTAFGVPTEDDDGNAAKTASGSGRTASQPGPAPISDADLTLIVTLCQAVGGSIKTTILEAYRVDNLGDLNARQAAAVIERLNDKLAEKAKAETNREARNA